MAVVEPIVTVMQDSDGWLDYVTAGGTVGAALVPLIFYFRERADKKKAQAESAALQQRTEAAERARDEAERRFQAETLQLQQTESARLASVEDARVEAEQRSQAELVHVWSDGYQGDIGVYCMNASRQPVSNVMIWLDVQYYETRHSDDEGLRDIKRVPQVVVLSQLPPSGESPPPHSLAELLDPLFDPPAGYVQFQVMVTQLQFVDARGVRWNRNVAANELTKPRSNTG